MILQDLIVAAVVWTACRYVFASLADKGRAAVAQPTHPGRLRPDACKSCHGC